MSIARATKLSDGCTWAADTTVLGAEATEVVVTGNNAIHIGVGAIRRATARIEEHGEFMASCTGGQYIGIAGEWLRKYQDVQEGGRPIA
jgi:hypothetical protein